MQSLASHPFFVGSGLDLPPFERRCRWKVYKAGAVFQDTSSDVFFVMSGDLRVVAHSQSDREVILGDLRAGEFFGELAAVGDLKRSADVSTLTRVEIWVMPANVFRDVLHASPVLADRLFFIMASRIRRLNARVMEHAVLDVRHRLYSELLRLSVPRKGPEIERIITPPPLHRDLAGRIDCRREQVTRELSNLVGEGLVSRTRGALVIHRPEKLQDRIAAALEKNS